MIATTMRPRTIGVRLAVVVGVAAMIAVLARGPRAALAPTLGLLLVAYAVLAVLVMADRADRVPFRLVFGASIVLLTAAVIMPPRQSHDLWSYAIYGRMVAHYHVSPYVHLPKEFPRDPLFAQVAWRHTRSVYGPGFTLISAIGMAITGASTLAARVFFQALSAAAVVAAMALVWRRTRSRTAVACIGLNPLVIVSVVNGGHNDALVGLGVLGAVLLLDRRRAGWAGMCLAGAALVKMTALLPAAAVAWWVWRRYGRRHALVLIGTTLGIVAAGYAVGGGTPALAALRDARLQLSGSSVWGLLLRPVIHLFHSHGLPDAVAAHDARARLTTLALVAVVVAGTLLTARRLRNSSPALIAGSAVLGYVLLGSYVLPWYLVWGLPSLALGWRSRLTRLALVVGALLHLAYVPTPRGVATFGFYRWVGHVHGLFSGTWLPQFELLAVLVLVAVSLRRSRSVPAALLGPVRRMGQWWPEFVLGLPCLALAVASRAAFRDGDTWPHRSIHVVAFVLLAAYATSAIALDRHPRPG